MTLAWVITAISRRLPPQGHVRTSTPKLSRSASLQVSFRDFSASAASTGKGAGREYLERQAGYGLGDRGSATRRAVTSEHYLGSPLGARPKSPEVTEEWPTRLGRRGQQPAGELRGREHDELGAILPRRLQLHPKTPVVAIGYAATGDGRAAEVLDQPVEFIALTLAHARIGDAVQATILRRRLRFAFGMQGVAVKLSTVPRDWPRPEGRPVQCRRLKPRCARKAWHEDKEASMS